MTRKQLIKAVAGEFARQHQSACYPSAEDFECAIAACAILALIERHAVIVPIEPEDGEIEAMRSYFCGSDDIAKCCNSPCNYCDSNAREARAALLAYYRPKEPVDG